MIPQPSLDWGAHRASRRPGVLLVDTARQRPGSAADLRAQHAATAALVALGDASTAAAADHGAVDTFLDELDRSAAAARRADLDRARRRRDVAALRKLIAHLDEQVADHTAEAAEAAEALRALLVTVVDMLDPIDAAADRAALTDPAERVDTGPPGPPFPTLLASSLIIAPGAPFLPALSAL